MAEIIYHMPAEVYHAHPAISCSGLKELMRSPAHYKYWIDNPKPTTQAMEFGTAYHMAVLEPEKFEKTYIVVEGNRQSNTVKDAIYKANANGKTVLKPEAYDKIIKMRTGLLISPTINKLLNGAKEASLFWHDCDHHIQCRARLDCSLNMGIITDLKSAEAADIESFTRAIIRYHYYLQAAFYADGYHAVTGHHPKGFVFIAQEKEPPYLAALYTIDPDDLHFARRLYKDLLRIYAECLQTNKWPGYDEKILDIYLPTYLTGR